jgi:hypothetical protein
VKTSPSPGRKSARELLRGRSRGEVLAQGEEREAELLERPPVDLSEPDLQHHLLALAAAGYLQQVDDLGLRRRRGGDLAGPQHHIRARHLPGEDDRLFADADGDVLAGEEGLEVLLERRDRWPDDHVALLPAIVSTQSLTFPASCRSNLARLDNDRVAIAGP